MFYSVLLTMAADAKLFELGVHQLAARIQYKGVAQRGAVRTLRHSRNLSLRICANQVNRFYTASFKKLLQYDS
jgi:hypothetical protein